MKINTTIIAPILLVTLIAGCAYGDRNLRMNTGAEAESAGVFGEFIQLVDGRDLSGADAIRSFLDQHPEAITETYEWEEFDYTFLHHAAEEGMLWLVKDIIQRGVPVDIKTRESGITPLQCAAKNGHLEIVKFLLEQGAGVYEEDNRWATALQHAASGSQLEVFKHLYDVMNKQRRYIPQRDEDGFNLLHLVALSVNEECDTEALERSKDLAEFIIQKYGDSMIPELDKGGCTTLQFAARNGNKPLVKLLIEHGANETVAYNKRCSAARMAQRKGHSEIAELISTAG